MNRDRDIELENFNTYQVPNLEKGLTILELLSSSSEGLSLQEIKAIAPIAQTTIYRILNTLVRRGYLRFDESTKRYWLSRKMLSLGLGSIKEHNLMDIALPEMRRIRDEIGESVIFGVLSNDGVVALESSIGTHAFCFNISAGKVAAFHCSAPGKAMLAFLPSEQRERYLRRIDFEAHNDNTIISMSDYLDELERVREMKYALDREEELYGVVCISAPILNHLGVPCACIWTSGPKDRLNEKECRRIGAILVQHTNALSQMLGYNISSPAQSCGVDY